jgi:autotransporter passenger strand-loop-strand repeat protein
MFGLSRLLELAGGFASELTGIGSRRRPVAHRRRPATLYVAELEPRLVPTLLGQSLFPADNPWNQNIASAPVAANSAAIIARIGASTRVTPNWYADNPANGSSPLYGMPFNVVHGNGTAKVNVIIDNYPGESDLVPVPIPANAVLEGDFQNGPNPSGGGYNANQRGDSHLIVWDEDGNLAYEMYGVTRPSDTTLFPNTSDVELPHTDGQWHAAQETVWTMSTNTFRTLGATSADAAGLSILAGLARPDEGLTVAQGGQGAIHHALRVTLPSGEINPQYVYPASHIVSVSQRADNMPLGGRLRLDSTPAIDTLISNMPPESQILARAMQQYGLIVADIGSAMYVSGASATLDTVDSPTTDLTWDLTDLFAASGLEALTAGDFQVVDLRPVVTGLSASSGVPGSTLTITGQNFSGAAGHLAVLFGGTPASSIKILNDTQLTAVVPNGSGTVDITVQSGVNESDSISSNPNANVNAPIFGYGTSAITAADQFTFSTTTPVVPTVTVVSPASGPAAGGTLVTITGTNFTGVTGVSFGGTAAASFSFVSSSEITARAPAGTAGQVVDITVTTAGGTSATSAADKFTFTATATYPPPANLHATPGNGSVTFSFDPVTVPVDYYPYAQLIGDTLYPIYVGFSNPFTITANNQGPLVNGQTYTFEVAITYAGNHTSAWSSPITVTVGSTTAAPIITTQPASKAVTAGQSATFMVAASGSGLTYQWQKLVKSAWVNVSKSNTSSFTGATTASFTIATAVATDAGSYRVVVANAAGAVISKTAILKVMTAAVAPTITLNPTSQTVTAGNLVTFTATASGSPLPTVQWQVSMSGGPFTNIPGATSTTLSFPSAASQNGNQYRAVFTNSAGHATTLVATLTVISPVTPPQIVTNPSDLTVPVGSTVTFTASATGNPPPTVQWQVSTGGAFTNIPGATALTYFFVATASDSGNRYQAVFTNSSGTATTTAATLTTTAGLVVGAGQQLEVMAGQTVSGVAVMPGGYLLVDAGGTDMGSLLAGGDETVQAGGQSIGTTIDQQNGTDGDIEIFGTATGLILDNGYINVDEGGAVTNTTINGDIMYVAGGGTANNTTIHAGGSCTVIGGGIDNGTILDGGEEFVRAGAVTNGTTVNNGGTEYVFAGGVANNLTLTSGGSATMLGTVNGATIQSGAAVTVFDGGGAANGTIIDNGTLIFDTSSNITFAGQLTGNGTLAVQGTGKLVVASALNSGVAVTIGNSSSLELAAAANANITFGYQSTLKLDLAQSFTGTLTATPGYLDVIDLADLPYVQGVTTVQYVENSAHSQGTLMVSNQAVGGPTVKLTLLGDFSVGTFVITADGVASALNPTPGTVISGPF